LCRVLLIIFKKRCNSNREWEINNLKRSRRQNAGKFLTARKKVVQHINLKIYGAGYFQEPTVGKRFKASF
jgi:hypothetical protein